MSRTRGELLAAAVAWIDGDPEPSTCAELIALCDAGDFAELAERLQPLSFGTAGLRGAVGAGPGRMNVAVVLRAAFGIAQYVVDRPGLAERPLVIGFDARPTSRAFAEASAEVLVAAGLRVVAFRKPTATPLCAFFGRELGAAITIVVTASHNPRGDNGYKVYGPDAVQIVAPLDGEIAQNIAEAPPARLVPRKLLSFDRAERELDGLTLLGEADTEAYFSAVSAAIPASSRGRELGIVHSALHGVGSEPLRRVLGDAGFVRVDSVAAQAEPDGSFPTTPFPNPEEPGTMDLGLAEAERRSAALLLVNDPDADRLAVAARLDGALTVLDGNQVGALLADYLLSLEPRAELPLLLSSVVSSPLVERIARARGAWHERTHTGFKWLWSAALELTRHGAGRFCFAYEEALGYSVFPAVRDKDGIAAGRAVAELGAQLASRDATLFDRLYELYAEHGMWISASRNVALDGADASERVAASLNALPARLGEHAVVRSLDYRGGQELRPAWLGAAPLIELELEQGQRLLVRPSGTEPKLKLYGHVRGLLTQRGNFARDMAEARRSAAALLEQLELALAL
ncbi:MAG TPA: phospho-sugar mutase [Polyangiaceae bacterium]|nr:phospho-sugar mutase [Polyangiaceae bacterium]